MQLVRSLCSKVFFVLVFHVCDSGIDLCMHSLPVSLPLSLAHVAMSCYIFCAWAIFVVLLRCFDKFNKHQMIVLVSARIHIIYDMHAQAHWAWHAQGVYKYSYISGGDN